MSNEQTYQATDVVKEYAGLEHLQRPEQTILNLIKARLPEMAMLDIGVGGGRTTLHFARLAKRYVGVDLSDAMVEACRLRFRDTADDAGRVTFATVDARDLSRYPDGSFDFVLFSFNGIDYMPHDDRIRTLAEIRRVGGRDALFCFSSHNLQSLPNLFSLRRCVSRSPRRIIGEFRHWLGLRRANPNLSYTGLLSQPHAVFNDGAHDFRLETYYVKPAEQVRQLQQHFTDIRLFGRDGEALDGLEAQSAATDTWIYYLCRMT